MLNCSRGKGADYALLLHKVYFFFEKARCACAGGVECGGILLGSYRGPHIEVVDFTQPGPDDEATLSSFKRKDSKHQDAATKAWHLSNRKQTYVGEWHSHPFGQPVPSSTDKSVWRSVVTKQNAPCLFVVVAPAGWKVFRMQRLAKATHLVALTESEGGSSGVVFR